MAWRAGMTTCVVTVTVFLGLCSIASAAADCPNNCSSIGVCNTDDGTCQCPYNYGWSDDCSQTRAELVDMEVFNIYRWVVVGVNAAMTAVVLGLLIAVIVLTQAIGRPTVQAGAYIFLALAFGSRVAYYALDPGAFYERFDPWLDRFLRYIFFPFIFSAYSLVLYFWASSYFRKNHGRVDVMSRLRILFIGFNAALYLVELAFTTLQFVFEDDQGLRREQAVLWYQVYLAVILLLISIAFLYYGHRIYSQLRLFPPESHVGLRALKRVTILTALTALCFIAGIVFNFVSWLLDKQTGVYYIVSDAIVESLSITSGILILTLLGRPRRLRAWRQDSSRDAGDEKLPILPDSTNSGDRYYGDE